MLAEIILSLIFVSQVAVISVVFPLRDVKYFLAASIEGGNDSAARVYVAVNAVIAVLGVVLLTLFWRHPVFASLTTKLLSIGVFFFVQNIPFVMLYLKTKGAGTLPAEGDGGGPGGGVSASLRFFNVVSPALVAVAVVLLLAYTVFQASNLVGGWDRQMLKVLIYLGANLFFAISIARPFYQASRLQGQERADKYRELRRTAPIFLYLSIGISLYYFGKNLLADDSLQRYRPVMMSLFLQLLFFLTHDKVIAEKG